MRQNIVRERYDNTGHNNIIYAARNKLFTATIAAIGVSTFTIVLHVPGEGVSCEIIAVAQISSYLYLYNRNVKIQLEINTRYLPNGER